MVEYGKQLMCDMCGKTHFLRMIDSDSDRVRVKSSLTYEAFPEGWELISYIDKLLCPKCHYDFDRLIDGWKKGG